MNDVKQKWQNYLSGLDYAFQPIVHTRSGIVFGLEAHLLNFRTAGFDSIGRLFTAAHADGLLHPVDLVLRKKAVEKFRRLEFRNRATLFFKLDNRLRASGNYKSGQTLRILKKNFIPHDALYFIISETADPTAIAKMGELVSAYKGQGFRIAIEVGSSSSTALELLKQARPDVIQLHSGMIRGIDQETNRLLSAANLTRAARILGAKIIAKGVTTEEEYNTCREIEVDFVQGAFICPRESDLDHLLPQYEKIRLLDNAEDQGRSVAGDVTWVKGALEYIEPIADSTALYDAFETFRMKKHHHFFPVINRRDEPVGILHENSFKEYAYSRFGSALLQNPSFGKSLEKFISPFPSAEVGHPVEELVRLYSRLGTSDGMLITEDGKYLGYLSAPALLRIVHEKNRAGRAEPQ